MCFYSQDVLVDISTAAMDTGGYGVFLTITSDSGSKVDNVFSYLGDCESLYEAVSLAEIFANKWIDENLISNS
ncbi:hypothetical protein BCUE_0532 [Candidatus Kinetoplastibacterium blastocrithidii TCC012E]|uniref:Uncharacterized protein n=1 Tax=Candidatus Kinetoplastidibacterium blastocrithidiae TCC012E TaxID=1208922 RepID=M1MDA9_9PROT|nr:hypothetical protein [Candidatus Kinetoplastibacterium blastocrithidii]AFZ83609.1 hypothetical protein CKBE_00420 [Candidatus Kinetoplastibacterium blastocrithidii (ex Strigomonas culicis)]AGF49730.1 hypothetical protein BCUE_0532 [Candidatus Kinetoplastibacterium blastocrithidii TCC012E]